MDSVINAEQKMESSDLFDEVSCEEFYLEDADRAAWLAELETDWINAEMQEVADENRDNEIDF
jgi:hypothetical protein